jgi:1,6-anhydro-N-acetylmuramate kinase
MDWIKTILDPRHPVQKADRQKFFQRYRYVIGATIASDFTQVEGCLLEGCGAGKLLRLRALEFERAEVPGPTRDLFAQWYGAGTAPYWLRENPDWASLTSLQTDLTQLIGQIVGRLLSAAGQAADRVLAIAFHHSGICHTSDSGGQTLSLLNPARLALQTGQNVMDQFSVKDRLEGGTGWPISALPLWLLWADRRQPQAHEHRVMVDWNQPLTLTWLPPSDGLDANYPAVQQTQWNPSDWPSPADDSGSWAQRVEGATQWIAQQLNRWQECRLTKSSAATLPPLRKLRVIVAGQPERANALQRALSRELPETIVVSCEDYHCPAWGLGALVAAMHGFLHVDQFPANLPWISGTEVPRILGTLTPGAPCRYRSLLIEMSDYRPPAMTLRDAV